MEDFDPDKFLSKNNKKTKSDSFDPDEFLSENDEQSLESKMASFPGGPYSYMIMSGLQGYDKYAAAPIRKFVTEKLSGKELEASPTGSEQAKMLGISDKPIGLGDYVTKMNPLSGFGKYLKEQNVDFSPADVAGIGLETIQDPTLVLSGALKAGKGIYSALPKVSRAMKEVPTVDTIGKGSASVSGGGLESEISGQTFSVKKPESLEELRGITLPDMAGQMPSSKRLKQIVSNNPDLGVPPLEYHHRMLENPKAMKELKLKFENLPTEDAKQIARYNYAMLNESENQIRSGILKMSGGKPQSIPESGRSFINAVLTKYNETKKSLSPMFETFRKSKNNITTEESVDLIYQVMSDSKLGPALSLDEKTGKIILSPFDSRLGVSPKEYTAIKRVIGNIQNGVSVDQIMNVRDYLRKSLDPVDFTKTSEIEKVRSNLLGAIENLVSNKYGDDVRGVFQQYAINEKTRDGIEKIIGGKLESMNATLKANPDSVVSSIFSNPNYAEEVRKTVGEQEFQKLVSSFINRGVEQSIDDVKGFLPHKFKNWLDKNDEFMRLYAPNYRNKMRDMADYGYLSRRFLDEVNPSGTAASLLEGLKPESLIQRVKQAPTMLSAGMEVAGSVNKKIGKMKNIRDVDRMMRPPGNKEIDYSKILSGLEGIFPNPQTAAGAAAGASIYRNSMDRRLNELKKGR
jgi:hypothetical protein